MMTQGMITHPDFTNKLKFSSYMKQQLHRYLEESHLDDNKRAVHADPNNRIKIDLHCHDHNSDVPDELWGRLLGLPETWLTTDKLVSNLKSRGSDIITITNHNNARSCWNLLDKGEAVLVGTEFTCYLAEFKVYMHVLTYGFTPEQEVKLNRLRPNLKQFLRYAAEHRLPVIMPHPLYFYSGTEAVNYELFEMLSVMFQRFEVLNAQRNLWQNMMILKWAQSLTPEIILANAKKHRLNPADFGVNPYRWKILTAGSDDHTGLFAGTTGVYLHCNHLQERLKTESLASLAKEALWEGNLSPFGSAGQNEKLNIAILDYFSHCALNIEDRGLLRLFMHRGELKDKVSCLMVGNALLEIKKSNKMNRLLNLLIDALRGKPVSRFVKMRLPKEYAFILRHLDTIAHSYTLSADQYASDQYADRVHQSIIDLYTDLNKLIFTKLKASDLSLVDQMITSESVEQIIEQLELPSQLTSWFSGSKEASNPTSFYNSTINPVKPSLGNEFSGIVLPLLLSGILLGVVMTSTRVLHRNRTFLNQFAKDISYPTHPKRALFLTDTLKDKNGVSNSLSGKLAYIQKHQMPIDFLICHETAEPEDHLKVLKPIFEIKSAIYPGQPLRVPNIMEVIQRFYEGQYDRIICSTEGPMSMVAMLLKYMFSIPTQFIMHTDWLDFIRINTSLDEHQLNRVRRMFRLFYKQFDNIFVLNRDHKAWLHNEMGIDPEKILLTAHHAQPRLEHVKPIDKYSLFPEATPTTPILLFAGRLSKEKGLGELLEIVEHARRQIPDLHLVLAGTGPDEAALKAAAPDYVTFTGWCSKERLASLYLGLDLFVFPSKFDTFGNVILESFSYGMPVISYNCKGPKDLISPNESGYLVETPNEFSQAIIQYYQQNRQTDMKAHALERVQAFQEDRIMQQFFHDVGLDSNLANYCRVKTHQQSVA